MTFSFLVIPSSSVFEGYSLYLLPFTLGRWSDPQYWNRMLKMGNAPLAIWDINLRFPWLDMPDSCINVIIMFVVYVFPPSLACSKIIYIISDENFNSLLELWLKCSIFPMGIGDIHSHPWCPWSVQWFFFPWTSLAPSLYNLQRPWRRCMWRWLVFPPMICLNIHWTQISRWMSCPSWRKSIQGLNILRMLNRQWMLLHLDVLSSMTNILRMPHIQLYLPFGKGQCQSTQCSSRRQRDRLKDLEVERLFQRTWLSWGFRNWKMRFPWWSPPCSQSSTEPIGFYFLLDRYQSIQSRMRVLQ